MKKALLTIGFGMFLTTVAIVSQAQRADVGYIRPNDKSGINVFEAGKSDTVKFDGVKVRIGGAFTQSMQNLKHSNSTSPKLVGTPAVDQNKLVAITNGFNTANANLNFDVALADGVNLNLQMYLSSRHHNETWVKGGYIQFDKFPFLNSSFVDQIMEFTTIRVGHMEINYGDAHFRRSDNGNSIYNPFIETYILDAFNTEIGGDIMFHSNGAFAMVGATGGEIKGDVNAPKVVATDDKAKRSPAFLGKLGYDKQFNDDLRVRISGSAYYTASSTSNNLYGGDRTGSHYYSVMEWSAVTADTRSSGRFSPGFSDKVQSMMGNLFVKFDGLEFFGTYETAKGRSNSETSLRSVDQVAADLVYRIGSKENFYVGARYNQVKADVLGITNKVTINRMAASAGWFLTKNILAKAEYVNQKYIDFPTTDIRSAGRFHGFVIEAVVAF